MFSGWATRPERQAKLIDIKVALVSMSFRRPIRSTVQEQQMAPRTTLNWDAAARILESTKLKPNNCSKTVGVYCATALMPLTCKNIWRVAARMTR